MNIISLVQVIHKNYEYAGFKYKIVKYPENILEAYPLEKQHPAASKYKHRQAAIDCFKQDYVFVETL